MKRRINDLLIEKTHSDSHQVVLAAIYSLGEAGTLFDDAVARLTELAGGNNQEIEIAALKALGRGSRFQK